jgi:DnaJ domain
VRTRDWAEIDFYAVLGLEPTAPVEDIAGAFRALAKQLHPDRPDTSAEDAQRFTTVVAAYEVLGDKRLRRAYDDVRSQTVFARPPVATTAANTAAGPAPVSPVAPAADPLQARRNARRWLAAGIGVLLAGIVVSVVIVRLQAHDRARRAGRVHADAVIVPADGHSDVRFTTSAGTTIQVTEPRRVDPGSDAAGAQLSILYRPDRPQDVIVDESTTARDITLWIVALKLLVGGTVFLVVGARRLRAQHHNQPTATT